MSDESPIAQHERRLSAALDRISKAVDRMAAVPAAATPPRRAAAAAEPGAAAEIARLTEALESERAANAQLTERYKRLRERNGLIRSQTDARVETMTQQLDLQGLELTRMKKVTIQLRETLRAMTEAAAAGATEPHLINKAMLAELEALRAQRHAEVLEMDEILTALAPLVEEAETDA
ncbi:MAG: hypothetical protein KF887_13325 [Paracoccaceae bacterium]|nr:MAG: hypothetical protein KF887_13325 [Paracoccaceae bacterium]